MAISLPPVTTTSVCCLNINRTNHSFVWRQTSDFYELTLRVFFNDILGLHLILLYWAAVCLRLENFPWNFPWTWKLLWMCSRVKFWWQYKWLRRIRRWNSGRLCICNILKSCNMKGWIICLDTCWCRILISATSRWSSSCSLLSSSQACFIWLCSLTNWMLSCLSASSSSFIWVCSLARRLCSVLMRQQHKFYLVWCKMF